MLKSRFLAFAIKEFKEIIAPTATAAALVVGKVVLIANALPFLRRFDRAPLIQPILFKTVVYFAVVFVVRFLEKIVEYCFHGGTLAGSVRCGWATSRN